MIRDLNFASAQTHLRCTYRKIFCHQCRQVAVEDLGFMDPYQRVTRRLARAIHELCKVMTVSDVARHYNLNWKTVKNIDKHFLEKQYGQTCYDNLRILAVDEIAIKKGHKYMTVVIDYETGRVVYMAKDRTKETLNAFFAGMTKEQKEKIEAVTMDMWKCFISSVTESVPKAKIVFDLYHVVSSFNKVIDKVRNSEKEKASKKHKHVYKGTKYLLLKKQLTTSEQRQHLKLLLELNQTISEVMILRDKLPLIWSYSYRRCAEKALDDWCDLARSVNHPSVTAFAEMLQRHRKGIINHCDYHIGTGKLEGINNKIKVIKRKAYGFHDERYFSLKVKQAFSLDATN